MFSLRFCQIRVTEISQLRLRNTGSNQNNIFTHVSIQLSNVYYIALFLFSIYSIYLFMRTGLRRGIN